MIEIKTFDDLIKNKKLIQLLCELNGFPKLEISMLLMNSNVYNKHSVINEYQSIGIKLTNSFFIDVKGMHEKTMKRKKIRLNENKTRVFPLKWISYKYFFEGMLGRRLGKRFDIVEVYYKNYGFKINLYFGNEVWHYFVENGKIKYEEYP